MWIYHNVYFIMTKCTILNLIGNQHALNPPVVLAGNQTQLKWL